MLPVIILCGIIAIIIGNKIRNEYVCLIGLFLAVFPGTMFIILAATSIINFQFNGAIDYEKEIEVSEIRLIEIETELLMFNTGVTSCEPESQKVKQGSIETIRELLNEYSEEQHKIDVLEKEMKNKSALAYCLWLGE